jgi:predicted dehydrogenase
LELIGDQGTICWDNTDGIVHLYQAEKADWQSFAPPVGFERNDLFLAEMKNFLDVIEGKSDPVSSLEDGIIAQLMVEAVYRSNNEQKTIQLI